MTQRGGQTVTPRNPRKLPLLVALALTLLVFMVLPASIYLGNLGEFTVGPVPIARLLLLPAALLAAAVALGLRLSRRQDFSRVTSIMAALALLAWAQSYLLVWDYGRLDGNLLDLRAGAWRGWVDASVWIGGVALAAAFYQRLEKPLATAAFAVVALQAATVAASGFAQRHALLLKYTHHYADNRVEAMARFSPERNVLHIVLDSFQADVFNELVSGPDGADLRSALGGFTFFEEHLGTFPATYLALPVIVSGQVYRNHIPQRAFMEAAYSRGSILNAARRAGFEVDIAADSLLLDLLTQGGADNTYLTAQLPLAQEAARLIDLALFRLAPHWLKPGVYNDQLWLTQQLFARSELMKFPYFTHNAFLARTANTLATDRPAPVYKFFHLMTTHAPFVVNADCSPAGRVVDRVRANVTAQSRCSLGFVIALLDRMKQAGIYDRSLIVLMGDHGGHIPPYRYQAGTIREGNMAYDLPADYVALATPLLAIKPPGATGPFRISSAFTSMADVAATIDSLLELGAGMPGRSLLDETRSPVEARTFYLYEWSKMDAVSEYVGKIQAHTVSGSAYDAASWRMGPVFLPPESR